MLSWQIKCVCGSTVISSLFRGVCSSPCPAAVLYNLHIFVHFCTFLYFFVQFFYKRHFALLVFWCHTEWRAVALVGHTLLKLLCPWYLLQLCLHSWALEWAQPCCRESLGWAQPWKSRWLHFHSEVPLEINFILGTLQTPQKVLMSWHKVKPLPDWR